MSSLHPDRYEREKIEHLDHHGESCALLLTGICFRSDQREIALRGPRGNLCEGSNIEVSEVKVVMISR